MDLQFVASKNEMLLICLLHCHQLRFNKIKTFFEKSSPLKSNTSQNKCVCVCVCVRVCCLCKYVCAHHEGLFCFIAAPSGFDELTCHCGASVIYPPVPCGTRPPECTQTCARVHECDHPGGSQLLASPISQPVSHCVI